MPKVTKELKGKVQGTNSLEQAARSEPTKASCKQRPRGMIPEKRKGMLDQGEDNHADNDGPASEVRLHTCEWQYCVCVLRKLSYAKMLLSEYYKHNGLEYNSYIT